MLFRSCCRADLFSIHPLSDIGIEIEIVIEIERHIQEDGVITEWCSVFSDFDFDCDLDF